MGAEDSPRRRRDTDGGPDECETIGFQTVLLSPDLELLDGIRVGMRLSVEVRREANVPTIGAFDDQKRRVGSISTGSFGRLVVCIEDGNAYFADVMRIEGAECQVKVHHQNR